MIKKLQSSMALTFLMLFAVSQFSYSQTVLTFTNAGATGRIGPTQSQVNTAYSSTPLSGKVTVSNGIQLWTVPSTGTYTIEASGAQGAGANGGKGARMRGEFYLTYGTVLKIIVGQTGTELLTSRYDWSGGGGSFVVNSSGNTPLVVAGGGGGAGQSGTAAHGVTATSGANGGGGYSLGNGGTGGAGGTWVNQTSDGGAGFTGNGGSGNPSPAPQSFINGGGGGCNSWSSGGPCAPGGFGGGGSTNRNSTTYYAAGGGGGYSGGGAAYGNSTSIPFAGGGGSYNVGSNQINTSGVQTGDGQVIIIQPPTVPNDAGVTAILSPESDCDGSVQDVEVQITNLGTNQITSVEIHWTINSVVQTTYNYSGLLDVANGTGPNSASVVIGNMTLVGNTSYDIVAWTEKPNNVNDIIKYNDSSDVSIVGYAYPSIFLGNDTTTCPNDPITLDAGSGRDSILWSTSATSQTIIASTAQNYMATVWKNGCASNDDINVYFFPAPPTVNLGPDTMICYGDSITLDATTAGVTYLWHDNSTAATYVVDTFGTYSVTIEDANTCKNSDEINVTLFSKPLISMNVIPRNTICYGSPFEFRANSFTQGSTMYQWKINTINFGTPTSNNKFSPTLKYGDSVNVELLTDVCYENVIPSNYIVMYLKPEPKLISGSSSTDTVLENTSKNYLVPIVQGSTFTWSAVGGTIGSPVGNAAKVDWGPALTSAKIMVTEKDAGNCSFTNERNVVIISIVGVKDQNNLIGIGYAYPNPANTTVTIPVVVDGSWDIDLSLYDISGKKVMDVFSGNVTGNRDFTFAVDDLENGLYFYKVSTRDGYESVKKLSVKH